jgi:GT2 family glycosyltransferase
MPQNHPLVSINLLTYNAERYIEACLNSVFNQTYPHLEILIIDNASTDGTVDYLKNFWKQYTQIERQAPQLSRWQNKPRLKIIFNQKNIGFAAGHNQGIKASKGEFILCLNQDVVLDNDFIRNAVEIFKQDHKVAAVQGKLLRWQVGYSVPHKFVDYKVSPIIDTIGLAILKNRRIINRGQGEVDQGQFEKMEEIFGADGAAPIYRREALEDIKIPVLGRAEGDGEYFDEDFFCYKEDVDLAWRLRLYGWKSIYQPVSIAWHARTAGDSATTNYFAIIRERLKISKFAKYLAFKNQRLMQLKNEQLWFLLKHFPWFLPKEIASWIYVLLFERYTWRAIKDLFRQMPRAWQKRKVIMTKKRMGMRELKKWFK